MAPKETKNNAFAKFLGCQTKSIMVCYGIFWRGQLPSSTAETSEERNNKRQGRSSSSGSVCK